MNEPPVIASVRGMQQPVDQLAWYRRKLREDGFWATATFVSGVLMSTLGSFFLGAMASDASRRSRILGTVDDYPFPGGEWAFWFGMALVAISSLINIRVTIRETHLEQAGRRG